MCQGRAQPATSCFWQTAATTTSASRGSQPAAGRNPMAWRDTIATRIFQNRIPHSIGRDGKVGA